MLFGALTGIVAAFALSCVLTRRFSQPGSRLYVLDRPNARSLHEQPIPRGGGVAILAAILLGGGVAAVLHGIGMPGWIALIAAALAVVSFVDDRRGVPAGWRMATHVLVALALIVAGWYPDAIELPGARLPLGDLTGALIAGLFVVWMINLYNFMDGMDGFAGGMTVSGFGTLALAGGLEGDAEFAVANAIVAAAGAGFLRHNFPPARIFMGDAGSSTLGFFAAVASLWGAASGLFPIWFPVLVFSPFIADATVTLLRRLLRGERVWEAHQSHYYQRLVRLGLGQRKTVLFQYALMLGCSLTALASLRVPARSQWLLLAAWGLLYSVYFVAVALLEKRQGAARRES
ncbi:MAG TPA: glycosyltransferase family 4 protein [Burkholderiales bacterium]